MCVTGLRCLNYAGVWSFRGLIMNSMKIYNVEEIKKILEPVFEEKGIKSAVLFGSYAKGIADG
jgi:hypothetical protein